MMPRSALAGLLLALMVASSIASGLWPVIPSWPSGVFAWGAGLLLLSRASRLQMVQTAALLMVGGVIFAAALNSGGQPSWSRLLDANTSLLSMLAAVSFLRLAVASGADDARQPPRGLPAFGQTMLAVALFGGFINISAPVLVADHLSRRQPLSPFAAQSITRVFTGGATWSPFFAGMAVVLTYIADAQLLRLMLIGLPFALIGLLLVVCEAGLRFRPQLEVFTGYPITMANLWLPLILALSVILGHAVLPRVPILAIIALAALAVSGTFLLFARGVAGACRQTWGHIAQGLPGMVGELLLFLAAGVLVVGLQALVAATELRLPLIGEYDPAIAGALLAAMLLTSACGIHPIIPIAVITPLLQPIHPEPHLLAMTYLFAWSLGTCASPLSAINLILQGRYGLSSTRAAVGNWPFVAVMFFVALAFLHLGHALWG